MARQVFYDPFGRRATGYQAGMEDERKQQAATRLARTSDFVYDNIAPLQLQGMQREEGYQQFADPYRRNAVPMRERQAQAELFGLELPIAQHIGRTYGDYALDQTGAIEYGRGTYGQLSGPQRGLAIGANRYSNANPEATVDDSTARMSMQLEQMGLPPELVQTLAPYLLRGIGDRESNEFPTYTEERARDEALYPRALQHAESTYKIGQDNRQRQQQMDEYRQRQQYYDMLERKRLGLDADPSGAGGYDDGF